MPFPEDPLEEITIPEGVDEGEPYVYIGSNDEDAQALNLVPSLKFETTNGGTTMKVFQGIRRAPWGTTTAEFYIFGADEDNNLFDILSAYLYPGTFEMELGSDEETSFGIHLNGDHLELGSIAGTQETNFVHVHARSNDSFADEVTWTGYESNQVNFQVNGTDVVIGPGIVYNDVGTAHTTPAGPAETVHFTTSNITFKANHIYSFDLNCGVVANTANVWALPKIRKNNLAGSIIFEYFRTSVPTTGAAYQLATPTGYFRVTSLNDVTCALAFTLQASAGTLSIFGSSSVAGRSLTIRDLGEVVGSMGTIGGTDLPVLS